jgi:cytochrome b561
MHWLMVAVFAGVYGAINLSELLDKGTAARQMARDWHSMLGLTVFTLVWLRLALRLWGTTPAIVPAPPAWQEKLGKAVHGGLYLFMVVTPLVGWALLTARGRVIPFYGLYLPDMPLPAVAQARLVKEVHEWLGNLGYALIGGHAVAALWHHYGMRDNTLRRMWFR